MGDADESVASPVAVGDVGGVSDETVRALAPGASISTSYGRVITGVVLLIGGISTPWPRRKMYIQWRQMARCMPPASVGKQPCLAHTSRKSG